MWQYEYDSTADKTTFRWVSPDGSTTETTISGDHRDTINGLPDSPEAREAIVDLVQSTGGSERIRMMWEANYPFEDATE